MFFFLILRQAPFRKVGGVRLVPRRAREIAEMMLDDQGATFTCHKTTIDCESDDCDGDRRDGPNAKHCAGALIFAELNQNATKMMRIAERVGLYDARRLMEGNDEAVASVFETIEEMVEAQNDYSKPKNRKKKQSK